MAFFLTMYWYLRSKRGLTLTFKHFRTQSKVKNTFLIIMILSLQARSNSQKQTIIIEKRTKDVVTLSTTNFFKFAT